MVENVGEHDTIKTAQSSDFTSVNLFDYVKYR